MTKVDIISGFLGAGKTTLIKKLLKEAYKGEQVVLIENEFGEIGIDGGFLKEAGIQITEMNSGCICCSLVGDFGEALKKVLEQYHPDRIIIEPSGVGKLSDVAKAVEKVAVTEPEMTLGSLSAVCDAKKCKLYMKNFGEFYNNQVENAQVIFLSRTADMEEEKIEAVVAMLREKNANAPIVTTDWALMTGEQFRGVMEENGASMAEELLKEEEEHHHHCHHHHDDDEEHECCCGHHHHDDDDDDDEDEHECHCHHHHDDDDDDDEDEHECHCHHHHDDDDDEDEHECHCHHHHDDDDDDEDEHECHCHHHHDDDDDEDEHECHCHHHHDDDDEDEHECGCGHHHDHEHHHHHHGHDADEVFVSWGKETAKKFDEDALKEALEILKDSTDYGIVLRAKGIVALTNGNWAHFDLVPGECELRYGAADYTGRLCVIGSQLKEEALAELFKL